VKRCNDCLYALEHRPTEFHCHHPTVNRERPSFLAGNAQAAATCYSERQNFVGRCGRQGRLFVPRNPPANPLAPVDMLDV
jgi:hypothetical protein